MLPALEHFYLGKNEPEKSCLLSLRDIILKSDPNVTETLKYGMPVFCYKGKMFCYLWVHKKFKQPYLGIVEGKLVEHADLIQEERSRMTILLMDAQKDLPVRKIKSILSQAIDLYKKGIIKIK